MIRCEHKNGTYTNFIECVLFTSFAQIPKWFLHVEHCLVGIRFWTGLHITEVQWEVSSLAVSTLPLNRSLVWQHGSRCKTILRIVFIHASLYGYIVYAEYYGGPVNMLHLLLSFWFSVGWIDKLCVKVSPVWFIGCTWILKTRTRFRVRTGSVVCIGAIHKMFTVFAQAPTSINRTAASRAHQGIDHLPRISPSPGTWTWWLYNDLRNKDIRLHCYW